MDAVDDKGITPLRLAHSRLRITRDGDDDAELPFTRKTEVLRIVEMLKEFLMATHGSKDETTELEELASKLSISDTLKQVDLFILFFISYDPISTSPLSLSSSSSPFALPHRPSSSSSHPLWILRIAIVNIYTM